MMEYLLKIKRYEIWTGWWYLCKLYLNVKQVLFVLVWSIRGWTGRYPLLRWYCPHQYLLLPGTSILLLQVLAYNPHQYLLLPGTSILLLPGTRLLLLSGTHTILIPGTSICMYDPYQYLLLPGTSIQSSPVSTPPGTSIQSLPISTPTRY